jgi:hypothetical protein
MGDSPAVIHAGVIVAHTVAAGLLGALAAEVAGPIAALVAVVCFVLSLVSPLYGATSANTEAFMLVPLLGSLLLLAGLARGADSRTVIGCGLLFGVAGLCKQVAVFRLPRYLVVLAARREGRWRDSAGHRRHRGRWECPADAARPDRAARPSGRLAMGWCVAPRAGGLHADGAVRGIRCDLRQRRPPGPMARAVARFLALRIRLRG